MLCIIYNYVSSYAMYVMYMYMYHLCYVTLYAMYIIDIYRDVCISLTCIGYVHYIHTFYVMT